MLLIKLLLAHFLGDFVFQPKPWVEERFRKKWRAPRFYLHLLVHGLLILLLFWDLSIWRLVLAVVGVHGSIDLLKAYRVKKKTEEKWFFLDQFLHILSLVLLWAWWEGHLQWPLIEELPARIWLYVLALVFLTRVSDLIIQKVMARWTDQLKDPSEDSLQRAGQYIGMLERLFVFTFIIFGNWQAIGFLIAAKSVFRFGNLQDARDRKLTEYILIGTLLSFGLATLAGLVVIIGQPLF